jgi:hypothetical protein
VPSENWTNLNRRIDELFGMLERIHASTQVQRATMIVIDPIQRHRDSQSPSCGAAAEDSCQAMRNSTRDSMSVACRDLRYEH